ncbi:carbonic anhydrase [Dichotomicrobium thermohalophilum]|uniref:Carbonic anhydrase n=1 Tax=Dichotomicrobium thermohalophilum TaxID=933063 RepID=A0A397PNT2_9HYPH|nr:carbonic anhydrase [Dichotomicrobium thermohalophilum]RIA47694.1 carbonic anhydrase [Dichotomicrobium thermohalophilum]
MTTSLPDIFQRNRLWAAQHLETDRDYFHRLSTLQKPDYLWIGCADSRVPANVITGLEPGEVFVHRNVANVVHATDMNCMSVVQYAIEHLGIRHIIICGHYGCGGVHAAMAPPGHELVDYWLDAVRATARDHADELAGLETDAARADRLCELNVRAQVRSLSHSPILQRAWERGEDIAVHGWIYGLDDGLLHDLGCDVTGAATTASG